MHYGLHTQLHMFFICKRALRFTYTCALCFIYTGVHCFIFTGALYSLCCSSRLLIQWVPELLEHVDLFHVNKSCNIECCGNKTHQTIQNVILSRGLELKLSLL